jgi:phosphoribosylformylglycinamidine synthase
MERRCQEVLDRCWQDKNNPILFIHDVGAGGLSNAIPELVKDSGHGGLIDLRAIPNSEPGMTPMEIWCNESQERYVLAISETSLEMFSNICERERCPYSIVGEITNGNNLEVYDSYFDNYPISLSLEILFGKPPKTHLAFKKETEERALLNLPKTVTNKLLHEVLRHPTVASKGFLITIGDRSITGLIARDQLVGPWQVPVSDYGLCKATFSSKSGEAMAMGERTPLALINASASAKIAVAEVVTNILPSGISNISDVKLSANWMGSPGKLQGNKDLFEAVEAVGMDLCPKWNMTIPVGKDSLSMSTEWNENDDNKSVISPLSLIVSGFSPVKDISIAVTPELKREKESVLLYIDLAKGKKRMGGSILSQIKGQMGGDAPDVECIKEMPLFVEAIYKLLSHKKILAYHDRSDGGLITTLCEMSFASRLGLSLDLDKVVEEDHELMNFLFNEELGVVIQVCSQDLDFVFETFNKTGLEDHIYNLGTLSDQPLVDINYKGQNILSSSLKPLLEHWHRVGFEIQSLRDNPATAESEYRNDTDPTKGGLKPNINFSIPKLIDLKSSRPRIAILREQGVNGQNEMAAAFHEVGFDCFDVHMTDLISSRHQLKDFEGLVACGGFSYGDVLGAGGGWANTILFNADLRNQFGDFFHNEEVFSLGVCNGCQALSLLKPLIPGTESWPRFKRNISEKFEARLVQVSVKDSPSIFFKGMEGAVIPVPVAHGEGKVEVHKSHLDNLTSNKVTSISYADHSGNQTEEYPANPNGSIYGIAGVTNESGNVTIMMPHPERAFLNDQYSWSPEEWSHYSPWIRFFLNAREFIK